MGSSEIDMYESLKDEFEMKLKRNLAEDEKEFLQWLANKHVKSMNGNKD